MINLKTTNRLLAMPVLWMGSVQALFGLLSLLLFQDGVAGAFLLPALLMMVVSVVLIIRFRHVDLSRVSFRESLAFATLTWVVTGILGALPIIAITHISFTDGVFESVSALTTTGATVLSGLDHMPKSFLLYRQFLQWMGGLGVVIFVVAVLPMLNVGGMRLLKAETPGPIKDDKLSPRIANTAHYLWLVYIALTLLCAFAYHLAGMDHYEAIAHSFTTVSTGGFSTHDSSLGYFGSHAVLMVANVFMLLGAINFALHFRAAQRLDLKAYWRDEETRAFLWIVVIFSLLLGLYLQASGVYHSFWSALSQATFHIISFITSTGFGAADFGHWPIVTEFALIFVGYLGGCAGSTAGGNKIIRNVITLKLIGNNINYLIHPHGSFVMK